MSATPLKLNAKTKVRERVSVGINQDAVNWAMDLIVSAMRDGGWSDINVKIKDGHIVHANRNDSLLPPAAGRTVQETGR